MKMKEFGPRGGGASLAPPLDPPMITKANYSLWLKDITPRINCSLVHQGRIKTRKKIRTFLCKKKNPGHKKQKIMKDHEI